MSHLPVRDKPIEIASNKCCCFKKKKDEDSDSWLLLVYDLFAAIVSVSDVITDVMILAQFYEKERYGFFWGSVIILCIAQCSYGYYYLTQLQIKISKKTNLFFKTERTHKKKSKTQKTHTQKKKVLLLYFGLFAAVNFYPK